MDFPLFPHDKIRSVQLEFMNDLNNAINNGNDFIAHAPTGLGKTAAVLAPLLNKTRDEGFTIFFLTSRHTQHEIILRTIKAINEKHGTDFIATSIIGKRLMCAQAGARNMRSSDFAGYCKSLKEIDGCTNFINTRQKNYYPTIQAARTVKRLKNTKTITSELIYEISAQEELCPYEIDLVIANSADVVICDYFYLFAPHIRDNFLKKLSKELKDCIIVIDEGHNLPSRARELYTKRLTTSSLKRGIREAKEIESQEALKYIVAISDILINLAKGMNPGEERIVETDDVAERFNLIDSTSTIVDCLEVAAMSVQAEKKNSVLGSIAKFINEWEEGSEGFCRLISAGEFRGEPTVQLSKRCLDPSLVTLPVLKETRMNIIMSGTLMPTEMYREILGFDETAYENMYDSPFPDENRLCLIIPQTTTKFTHRSPQQFQRIGGICANIANEVEGCSAFFFPSYALLQQVYISFNDLCKKTTFIEQRGMSKTEKQVLLKRFASYKNTGATLLGVASGSFGEGIDLPGVLSCVVVVGLPLDRPDLETKELIKYYNKKFGRGVDFGYILPALTRTLQNAGRCIRSETDRGALIFLDERYSWPIYRRCFPKDWNIYVDSRYQEILRQFYDQ